MNRSSTLRLRADLALMAVALIWGSTFVIVKEALEQVSTLLFLALRFALAAGALAVIYRFRPGIPEHHHWGRRRELAAGALAGAFLFGGYVFQTAGLRYTTAAKAGFITGFYIPLVPLIGAVVYRRLPHIAELIGIAAATFGMGLMTIPPGRFEIARGDLLVLGCSFAYAAHILLLGKFTKHVGFERLTIIQIATGALAGMGTFWWVEPPKWHLNAQVVFAIALTGLLATAFAFSMQTWAQQFTTPTRTALIFSLEPVFAWLTAYLLAGEVLTGRVAVGAILILAGILCVELKPVQKRITAA